MRLEKRTIILTSTAPRTLVYTLPSAVETAPGGSTALRWNPGADPFTSAADLGENDALQTIQLRPEALSKDECRQVIELGQIGRAHV